MKFYKISENQFYKDFNELKDITYEELILPKRATKYSQELPKPPNYKPCGSGRKYKMCCGK